MEVVTQGSAMAETPLRVLPVLGVEGAARLEENPVPTDALGALG